MYVLYTVIFCIHTCILRSGIFILASLFLFSLYLILYVFPHSLSLSLSGKLSQASPNVYLSTLVIVYSILRAPPPCAQSPSPNLCI